MPANMMHWMAQPQFVVHGANSFYPGVIKLIQPQFGVDSVANTVLVPIGTQVLAQTAKGVARRSDGGGTALAISDSVYLQNWTVFWYGSADIVDNSGTSTVLFASDDFGESDISTNRDGFVLYNRQVLSTSGLAEAYVNGTGGTLGSLGMTSGGFHAVVFSRNGATLTVYVDGVSKGTITVGSATGYRAYQFLRLGCHRFSGANNQHSSASHLVFGVADAAWDARHAVEFARFPFDVHQPLQGRKKLPAIAGASFGTADLDTDGAATATATGAARQAADIDTDGAAVATATGAALASSNIDTDGAAVATGATASLASADLSAAGAAVGTLEGSEVGVTYGSADLSVAGAATATATGAARLASDLSVAGAGVATGAGAATIAAALSAAGAAVGTLEGEAAQPGVETADLSSAGAATATATGAATIAAALSSAGSAEAILATPATATEITRTWGDVARRRRVEIDADDQELVELLAMLLPKIDRRKGIRR